MGHRWTSDTLPPTPSSATSELSAARDRAAGDLLSAEKAEALGRSLRTIANQSCEHYKTLLEELATDPLFDLEEADGPT